MYAIKTNKETGKQEVIKEIMNVHSSIIDKVTFDEVFSREYARAEMLKLTCKLHNSTIDNNVVFTVKDTEIMELLEENFDIDNNSFSVLDGINETLKPLMVLTLYAHNALIQTVKEDRTTGKKSIKAVKLIDGNISELYSICRKVIKDIENGSTTIETGVDIIKPYYRKCCGIINHNAVDGVCKKWEESTKEKNIRAFVLGLLSHYKLVRINRIKRDTVLKSEDSFFRYFAMWLVTEGDMVQEKIKHNNAEYFSSYCARK